MKNLVTFLVFVFITATLNVHAVINSPDSNSYDAAGSVKKYDKQWIVVRNMTGSSIAAGSIVRPDTGTYDDGISVVLVTASTPLEQPMCMTDEAIADKATGKCQIRGYTSKLLFDAAITAAVGEGIYLGSATAGRVIASDTVTGYGRVGIFLDASAASGAIEAYLDM